MSAKKFRLFAFYLPQFHPFPENDSFWGKGFTEWHNVTSSKPLFQGHHQPHLPSDLGYYDLRIPEVMQQQSKLAEQYGLDGFIFYHYWFNGKPLMEKPLNNYRNLGSSKLPYFFCWANEGWNRRWDGSELEVLIQHKYNEEDDKKHFDFLLPFFKDEKYVKINNRPVLALYRPKEIPYLRKWTAFLNQLAVDQGYDGIYLIYVINLGRDAGIDIIGEGFDAGIIFQPGWREKPIGFQKVGFKDKLGKLLHLLKIKKDLPLKYRYELIKYPEFVAGEMNSKRKFSFPVFNSVFPGWDNSARRKKGGGRIFTESDPEVFKKWLSLYYYNSEPFSDQENFLIINAWNEWAEGNHLEPCAKWGRTYLEKVKEVVDNGKIEI